MAVTQAFEKAKGHHLSPAEWVRTAVSVLLPIGAFGLANLLAERVGIQPLFFSPFGLSGVDGAILHFILLAGLGAAYASLTRANKCQIASFWIILTTAGYITLPFATVALDPLQLTLANTSLFLLTLSTMLRVQAHSSTAARFMLPALGLTGVSMLMGLLLAASYLPPFAPLFAQSNTAPL